MLPPICPIHNVNLELKTAGKGIYAGQQFWGCPKWKAAGCQFKIPFNPGIDGSTNNSNQSNSTQQSSLNSILPHSIVTRSRVQGYQVKCFETTAFPDVVLQNLINGEIESTVRTYSQWRLDYPSFDLITKDTRNQKFTERERQAIAVVEKILSRGHLTMLSPSLEKKLKEWFSINDSELDKFRFENSSLSELTPEQSPMSWLDSPAEEKFYIEFILKTFGSRFYKYIIPQVEISSLISTNNDSQVNGRVDFLIYDPSHEPPVIVEIDGSQHHQDKQTDDLRDAALMKDGYKVIRIPAFEIEALKGPNLDELINKFNGSSKIENQKLEKDITSFIYSCKIACQLQLAIFEALKAGFLSFSDSSNWNIGTDLGSLDYFDNDTLKFIIHNSINDLIELLRKIGLLYSINLCESNLNNHSGSDNDIFISFMGCPNPSPTFHIQEISAPFHIANSVFNSTPAILDRPTEENLLYFLNYLFRKQSFWEGQYDAICRTLEGKDSIVLLPTGAGKSLVFQLASFLLPGRTLVVDPIISLMDDQVDNLKTFGIDRVIAINSRIKVPLERTKILDLFAQGEYLLGYISPERFQTIQFRKSLITLTTHTPISLIAVDEAHCISEWGHDFKTAYLNIGRTSREHCQSNGITPPLLALTGTASRSVLKDVQRELQIEDFESIITPKSFDRPELEFIVLSSSSGDKEAKLFGYLNNVLPSKFDTSSANFFNTNKNSTYSGLVFCPHINGNYGIVQVADNIKKSLSIPIGIYGGSKPDFYNGTNWDKEKQITARNFKHNQIPLLICTKSFGMGIDKPNIRYTIHYGVPSSIESFYQEAGRAGRDQKTSICCLIVSNDDPKLNSKLLDPNTPAEEIADSIKKIPKGEGDDIARQLYFQVKSFPGISKEVTRTKTFLVNAKIKTDQKSLKISVPDIDIAEKVIHRLIVLGIFVDYTLDYSRKEFTIKISETNKDSVIDSYGKYVAGYLGGRQQTELQKAEKLRTLSWDDFVLEMIRLLLHFIYDVIEKGRRRAISEMLLAVSNSPTDESIRKRILQYLEATQYSEALEKILAGENAGLEKTREAFESIRSPNEAAEMRGQTARYLESYPDHPGLLMLRALAELFCRDKNPEISKQNFLASISSAAENYSTEDDQLSDFIVWAIMRTSERDIALATELELITFDKYPNRTMARGFIQHLPIPLIIIPAEFLINQLIKRSNDIIH